MRLSKSFHGIVCLAAIAFGLPAGLLACWPTNGKSTSGGSTAAPAGTGTTDPPVIESLDMDSSALYPRSDGTYLVFGNITYDDSDDVVTAFTVYVPVLGKTYKFPVANPVAQDFGAPISFTLSSDPPLGGAGVLNYELALVNKSGSVSAPALKQMDLE